MIEYADGIELRIVLPDVAALREVSRGAAQVSGELGKMAKKLADLGLDTGDVRARQRVWEGLDEEPGVMAQLADQLNVFIPAPAGGRMSSDTLDMFDGAPVATDPSPSQPAKPVLHSGEQVRGLLAQVGVYLPAVAIERMPDDVRLQVQDWAELSAKGLLETGEMTVEQPEWLISYPLPEGFARAEDCGVYDTRNPDTDSNLVPDAVEWLEKVAEEAIAQAEAAAGEGADPAQPWIVVPAIVGPSPLEVMHRTTRERRTVDASGLPAPEDGAAHAADAGPEEIAAAYALHLCTIDPNGQRRMSKREVALLLRRDLFNLVGLRIRLNTLEEWTDDQRSEALGWCEDAGGDTEVPAHALAANVLPTEFSGLHPDEDFANEMAAAGWTRDRGEWFAPGQQPPEAPAPAHVVSMLAKVGRIIPAEYVAGWSDGQLIAVAEWCTGALNDPAGAYEAFETDAPDVLTSLHWEDAGAGRVRALIDARGGNFEVVGNSKVARVHDTDSGLYYGDRWTPAMARTVASAWGEGNTVEIRGVQLPPRASAVLLED